MSYRSLSTFGAVRDDRFYIAALHYAQTLWLRGLSARALLAATRALYANPRPDGEALAQWPLPYRAIHWICSAHDGHGFLGNPRISYQHQAGRITGAAAERKRARAWAAWYLVRLALPELPGDPHHRIAEPSAAAIHELLLRHGIPGEAQLWMEITSTSS